MMIRNLFNELVRKPVGRRSFISYGKGPEGEEVMIDIREARRIPVATFLVLMGTLPVVMGLFSVIYGVDSLQVNSANCLSNGWYIVCFGVLCGSCLNRFLQTTVYGLVHPRFYSPLSARFFQSFFRKYPTLRFLEEGNGRIVHVRTANLLAHGIGGYIPLLLGFVTGDISLCYLSLLSVMCFLDEIRLVWRLRHCSGQALCSGQADDNH